MQPHPHPNSSSQETTSSTLRFGLFGCPPSTGNRGVDALRLSLVEGLARAASGALEATVFGYDSQAPIEMVQDDLTYTLRQTAAYFSRRFVSPSNLQTMRLMTRAGLGSLHPRARELRTLHAILDVSGGDSFADIYGPRRFQGSLATKRAILAAGAPLILPPQTFGPYRSRDARQQAADIFRKAAQVWARDTNSLEVVQSLLGGDFDPERHRQTVDAAFALGASPPTDGLRAKLESLRSRSGVLVALNVSGLLFNVRGHAKDHFGFQEEYPDLIREILSTLLSADGTNVLLVSHVASSYRHDSDAAACHRIMDELQPNARDRVLATPPDMSARQVKWAVGLADWTCATRMHAAIAAISQGIPTAAIAYSDKTLGVFETAGVADAVVDPRRHDNRTVHDLVMDAFERRESHAERLASRLPHIRADLDSAFAAMIELVDQPASYER